MGGSRASWTPLDPVTDRRPTHARWLVPAASLWGRLRSSSLYLRARGLRERFLDGVWWAAVWLSDPIHEGERTAVECTLAWSQFVLFLLVWPGQSAATLAALCHASLGLALLAAAFTCARLMATRAMLWLLRTCAGRCCLRINGI